MGGQIFGSQYCWNLGRRPLLQLLPSTTGQTSMSRQLVRSMFYHLLRFYCRPRQFLPPSIGQGPYPVFGNHLPHIIAKVLARNPGRYSQSVIKLRDTTPISSATSLMLSMSLRRIEGT